MINNTDAARDLLGLELNGNWKVVKKLDKIEGQTGSFFSVCYEVERNLERCFLKAFDFSQFLRLAKVGQKVTDLMSDMLIAHRYEKDLSLICQNERLDKIVTIREADEVIVQV